MLTKIPKDQLISQLYAPVNEVALFNKTPLYWKLWQLANQLRIQLSNLFPIQMISVDSITINRRVVNPHTYK